MRLTTCGHVVRVAPLANRLLMFWADESCTVQIEANKTALSSITLWYSEHEVSRLPDKAGWFRMGMQSEGRGEGGETR